MTQLAQEKLVRRLMSILDKIEAQQKLIDENGGFLNCPERYLNVLDIFIKDFETLYYEEAWKLDDAHLAQVQKKYFCEI